MRQPPTIERMWNKGARRAPVGDPIAGDVFAAAQAAEDGSKRLLAGYVRYARSNPGTHWSNHILAHGA